jgi:hypothetical protein
MMTLRVPLSSNCSPERQLGDCGAGAAEAGARFIKVAMRGVETPSANPRSRICRRFN